MSNNFIIQTTKNYIHTYMQTNLYSAKIVKKNQSRWRRVIRDSESRPEKV